MTQEQANPDNFSKEDFKNFVTEVLTKGREIGEIYHKLFTGDGDAKAYVSEIEDRLEKIKSEYQNFFGIDTTTSISKIQALNEHIRTIKEYHAQLLVGDESVPSIKKEISDIKDNIKDSQTNINAFYNELFDDSKPDGGKKMQLEAAIATILGFHKDLTKADGYIKATEDAYAQIIDLHDDIFIKQDAATKQSKVVRLQKEMANISEFNAELDGEIKDFIKATQSDIARKQEDIGRLLGSALGPILVQGYFDSKNEYRRIPKYINLENKSLLSNGFWIGISINLYRTIMSLLGLVMDYVFFVLPLILSVLILTQQTGVIEQLDVLLDIEILKSIDVVDRLLISVPLWWISLFGYKNIRDKNRLAEEYNHKAQVANMYNKFSSEEATYPIEPDIKKKLQDKLIDVIARNPSEIYGRDETVFDKISKIILAIKGVQESSDNSLATTGSTHVDPKVLKQAVPATQKTT